MGLDMEGDYSVYKKTETQKTVWEKGVEQDREKIPTFKKCSW